MKKQTRFIDDYINGHLSGTALARFEEAIQKDAEIAASVEQARALSDAFLANNMPPSATAKRRSELDRSLRSLHREKGSQGSKVRLLAWSALAVATVVVIGLNLMDYPKTSLDRVPAQAANLNTTTIHMVIPTSDPRVKLYWAFENTPGRSR